MSDFLVTAKTSLRPDPDDGSPEVASLDVNSRVARLHDLGTWAKVSYQNGALTLGWLHADVLKEIAATQITLFDEPFGTSKVVLGEIVGEKVQLLTWKKVRVRQADGSIVDGWIDTAAAPAGGPTDGGAQGGAQGGASGGDNPAHGDGGDLALGPNELFRASLLKAEDVTDIDAAALAALIDAEAARLPSGQWNPNSQATTSSAAGLTQFLDSTWISVAKTKTTQLNQAGKAKGFITAGNDVANGMTKPLLDLRFDPEQSILAAADYGLLNLNALVKDGLVDEDVGDDDKARFIYIAHHEGLGGAEGFLKGTKTYTFSDLAKQVGGAAAQTFVDAAGGDTTRAYHNWLDGYVDKHIQPSKFRRSGPAVAGGTGSAALAQFSGAPILITELSGKTELAKAIQWRLSELGYLDPPADGFFGPVSAWALSEFCDLNGIALGSRFTQDVARKLLSPAKTLPDIAPTGSWFDKVMSYMKAQKYFVCRHPDCKNIVYLEGANADGTLNDDLHNVFNDLRIVFTIGGDGRPNFDNAIWEGTTEPGDFWTIHPMNPKGAARIAFNQYKAWVVGVHHPGTAGAHEALVQAEPISVFRDLNKDFSRAGDALDTGLFAINQHWGYDAPKGDLGRTSAGCLVGRTRAGHRQFMSLAKDDARYKVNRGYRFLTAVMPGDKVLA